MGKSKFSTSRRKLSFLDFPMKPLLKWAVETKRAKRAKETKILFCFFCPFCFHFASAFNSSIVSLLEAGLILDLKWSSPLPETARKIDLWITPCGSGDIQIIPTTLVIVSSFLPAPDCDLIIMNGQAVG